MLLDSKPTRRASRLPDRAFGVSLLAVLVFMATASVFPSVGSLSAQTDSRQTVRSSRGASRVNYTLAARIAPYKIQELVYSTSVTPRWIEGGERFWYEWETSDGKFFYIVDPVVGTKRQLFDRDRIAAELTRITRDPWDAQHLPIREIKFLDQNTLQFEVESSQDDEEREVA